MRCFRALPDAAARVRRALLRQQAKTAAAVLGVILLSWTGFVSVLGSGPDILIVMLIVPCSALAVAFSYAHVHLSSRLPEFAVWTNADGFILERPGEPVLEASRGAISSISVSSHLIVVQLVDGPPIRLEPWIESFSELGEALMALGPPAVAIEPGTASRFTSATIRAMIVAGLAPVALMANDAWVVTGASGLVVAGLLEIALRQVMAKRGVSALANLAFAALLVMFSLAFAARAAGVWAELLPSYLGRRP